MNHKNHDLPAMPLELSETLFSTLALNEALLNSLASLNYIAMTPIQAQGLPMMLQHQDMIAEAKTGSGKTIAFALCLLNNLDASLFKVQALVLCPARELAEQVSQVLRQLARLMPNTKIINLSGGLPIKPQEDALKHGVHIVVGTPGRVQKHLDNATLCLDNLKIWVLDEADRMLDMGFFDGIKTISTHCPKARQTLLFSATYSENVKKLAKNLMQNPAEVRIENEPLEQDIEQIFYATKTFETKFALLKSLLLHYSLHSVLIFCNTKQQTTLLTNWLVKAGFSALALNGDMEQVDRDRVMIRFTNQSCAILVATDVAARGLDIKALPAVINFDLAFEHTTHIHRIGRTGRAGDKGLALSLITPEDAERVAIIEAALMHPLTWGNPNALENNHRKIHAPEIVTFYLTLGKKDKVRPGDILGALIKDAGLPSEAIGKIHITPTHSYVAIHKSHVDQAYQYLQQGKIKGRKIIVKILT